METNVSISQGTQPIRDKIGLLEKLSFFLGSLGEAPVFSIISSFLLIFYTNVVKLNPAAVGTLFLVAKVFDGTNDIFIGFLIDHMPMTKWGRFRPSHLIFGFLASINFCLLWLGPSMAATGKLAIAYITYLMIGITYAGLDISLGSLLPCMTFDNKERNSLSILKALAMIAGNGIPVIVMIPLIAKFPTPKQGYHTIIVVVSIFVMICIAVCATGVKERVSPIKKERYPLSVTFKILFQTKPVYIAFIAMFFMMIGMQIRGGAVMYYLTYNIGDANLMSVFSAGTLLGMLLGIFIFPKVANRLEKRIVLIICLAITALGFLSTYFIPVSNITLLILTNAIACIGEGGFSSILLSLQADLVDYAEWKHGYRAEGAVISLNSFVMKMGIALGGAIPAYVLAIFGFNADLAVQSPSTTAGILSAMSIMPFILVCIGIVVLLLMGLYKKKIAMGRE